MNRIIKLFLFSFGLFVLFALIYRVGFWEVLKIITKAKIHLIILGIFFYITLIFARSVKWFLLLRTLQNKIRYKQFFPFYLVNSLMGFTTPFKSGEMITPLLLKKYLEIPAGQGFSVVLLDRFFELIIFLLILLFAVFYILNAGVQNSPALFIFQQIFLILGLLISFLIIIIASKKITLKMLGVFNFLKRFSPIKKFLEFIERELDNLYNALSLFRNKKVYRFMIPLTLLVWFFEIIAYYLVFNSVFYIPFIDVAVSQMIAAAATFATFIPGGMGVAEFGAVYVLGLIGYPDTLTLSGALLVRFFLTGTLLTSGLIGVLLIKRRSS